jgi:hypothetical protein
MGWKDVDCVGGGKVIVMMIMSLNLPVNSFPLRRHKRDSSQTVVLGFTLLYLVPIMDLFQMMGMGGTGLTGVGGWGLLSFRALEEVQSRLALISLTIL